MLLILHGWWALPVADLTGNGAGKLPQLLPYGPGTYEVERVTDQRLFPYSPGPYLMIRTPDGRLAGFAESYWGLWGNPELQERCVIIKP